MRCGAEGRGHPRGEGLILALVRPALLLLALALAACAGGAAPEVDVSKGQIRADLREYAMGLTSTTVRSGEVAFVARNVGSTPHELVVIRTDLAADKLPVDQQTQKASEQGRVDGTNEIAPGKSLNLRVQLPPGHYVVICNVPTHYQLGMRADLTVQ